MWELDGWKGLAHNFAVECNNPKLQDLALEKWWAEAVAFRRGGWDRIIVAAPYSPTAQEKRPAATSIRGRGLLPRDHLDHAWTGQHLFVPRHGAVLAPGGRAHRAAPGRGVPLGHGERLGGDLYLGHADVADVGRSGDGLRGGRGGGPVAPTHPRRWTTIGATRSWRRPCSRASPPATSLIGTGRSRTPGSQEQGVTAEFLLVTTGSAGSPAHRHQGFALAPCRQVGEVAVVGEPFRHHCGLFGDLPASPGDICPFPPGEACPDGTVPLTRCPGGCICGWHSWTNRHHI